MLDARINDARDARYASHVNVLKAWLAGGKWKIVEFGCGRFSTPVLIQYADSLHCYEKSNAWRRDVALLVPGAVYHPVPETLPEFETVFAAAIDGDTVVFVDGSPGAWRINAIRQAQARNAKLIIAHDWSTSQVGYGYHLLAADPRYTIHSYKCQESKIRTAAIVRNDAGIKTPKSVIDHKS